MASDITLAVGDDARRIAYAELGQLRAVPRPISGNAIATTEFDGSGLAEALSDGTGQETPANGPRPDPGNVGALESAVEGLRETIAQQHETIRHLRSLLADERRRMLVLLTARERRPFWRRWFR